MELDSDLLTPSHLLNIHIETNLSDPKCPSFFVVKHLETHSQYSHLQRFGLLN